MLIPAALVIAVGLVLVTPRDAVAQVSIGFGITIGGPQRPDGQLPAPGRAGYRRDGYYQLAFSNGYADGFDKGRDDGEDRRRYDPLRHKRYRQADHKYQRQYGPRIEYQNAYRNGFSAGYDAGYRGSNRYPYNYPRFGQRPWPY